MLYADFALEDAEAIILAHSLALSGRRLKKGARLTARDLNDLKDAGITHVTGVQLDEGDVHEDEAAQLIASGLAGEGISLADAFTGRVNLFADTAGLLKVDKKRIDALNRIDPSVTFATLPANEPVEAGRMIATVKIIPFAISQDVMQAIGDADIADLITVAPFKPMRVGLIATTLPHLKSTMMDKTRKVTEDRLAQAGAKIYRELRVPHSASDVSEALAMLQDDKPELIIIFGASAVVDRADTLPAGLRQAGGSVTHLGMPVDPGNLLMLGQLGDICVIGAPGCARSPKENGFDWILARLLAGETVVPDDIMGMGVGGLLMEIVSRPQPREEPQILTQDLPSKPTIGALLLAAGQSRRMGKANKLLATFEGTPLVAKSLQTARSSELSDIVVVTGHEEAAIKQAISDQLDDEHVTLAHNPDFGRGLASSIRAGISALDGKVDAALVILADMPQLSPSMINQLIDAYDPNQGALVVVPTVNGKRGNPILWSARYFDDLLNLSGDAGARHLIAKIPEAIVEVEIGEAAALDVDTPDMLMAAGGVLP